MSNETKTNVLNLPCGSCARELEAIINRPMIKKLLVDGFLFYFCEHHQVHCCWTEDGHLSLQFCKSQEHGEMINGGYIAAGEYHRKHLAQLLSHELARYNREDLTHGIMRATQ